jgi:hypothetical protein
MDSGVSAGSPAWTPVDGGEGAAVIVGVAVDVSAAVTGAAGEAAGAEEEQAASSVPAAVASTAPRRHPDTAV